MEMSVWRHMKQNGYNLDIKSSTDLHLTKMRIENYPFLKESFYASLLRLYALLRTCGGYANWPSSYRQDIEFLRDSNHHIPQILRRLSRPQTVSREGLRNVWNNLDNSPNYASDYKTCHNSKEFRGFRHYKDLVFRCNSFLRDILLGNSLQECSNINLAMTELGLEQSIMLDWANSSFSTLSGRYDLLKEKT